MSALLAGWVPRTYLEAQLRHAFMRPIQIEGEAGVLLDLG